MKQSLKVKITESEIAGDYLVAERNEDGSVLLAPDTSVEAIHERLGTKPASHAEFEEHFGDLPSDGEG